jgi:hypothetical protein
VNVPDNAFLSRNCNVRVEPRAFFHVLVSFSAVAALAVEIRPIASEQAMIECFMLSPLVNWKADFIKTK